MEQRHASAPLSIRGHQPSSRLRLAKQGTETNHNRFKNFNFYIPDNNPDKQKNRHQPVSLYAFSGAGLLSSPLQCDLYFSWYFLLQSPLP